VYLVERRAAAGSNAFADDAIVLRPSQRIRYPDRARLGEAVVAPQTPTAPKGLVLLDHVHTPKHVDPGAPGAFVIDPARKLATSDLNPGFIDASDNLLTDTSSGGLQTCLQRLITTQFNHYLGKASNTAPSGADRLRVALVDLSGAKIARPDFAGWGSTAPVYAASVAKILAVYAAHQLRMDLRQLAAAQGIGAGAALEKAARQSWALERMPPDMVWLFDIRRWSAPAVLDFTPAARAALAGIMHNAEAGSLIAHIGFPYLGSLAWQSGLFHPTRGGLWLTSAYGHGESWAANPIAGVNSANVTALSAAAYFTLLAQGRLVDDAASASMRIVLQRGCITGLFPQAVGPVASKCGIYADYLHDCALVVRPPIRYVVVGLTRTRGPEYAKYTRLFTELDNLIVRNNQTPRPSC
jgi:hypothetical protein